MGRRAIAASVSFGMLLAACGASDDTSTVESRPAADAAGLFPADAESVARDDVEPLPRHPDVPDLPFDDNPDPDQCGIPVQWGLDDPAWLTGMWEGELIQPEVLLYDSHLRLEISGRLDHGAEVEVVLFQENPVLDYYLVRSPDGLGEGWVPEPFLSFEPVAT